MTRGRKVLFGTITLVSVLAVAEGGARAYAAIRHGNPRALSYGFAFLGRIAEGTAHATPNTPNPFAALNDQEVATDRAFALRHPSARFDDWRPEEPRTRQVLVGDVIATLNRHGFRGRELTPTTEDSAPRIGVFGGSFAFGHGLRDDETWPARLEQRLTAEGRRVEVLNFGTNGANVYGVLATVVQVTRHVPLDFVVMVSAYNNHALLPIERNFTWARVADFYLYNSSMLHVMLKEKLSVTAGQPVDYGLYRQRVRVDAAAVDAWIRSYRTRLQQAALLCRERNMHLVLMGQPQVFFDTRVDALDLYDTGEVARLHEQIAAGHALWLADLEFFLQARLNIEARTVATQAGVGFVDAANIFAGDKASYFLDQIHPNRAGSEIIADTLAAFLRARLPRRGAPAE
jgi:lysophospholipase L1-like esterase